MMPLFVLAVIAIIAVMFLAVAAHRRMTEAWLRTNGTRVNGRAVTVAPPLSAGLLSRLSSTVTIISFTSRDGQARSLTPRSGAMTFTVALAGGGVTVLYDADRPTSEDRIRVGFGAEPTTWHRVRLRQAA
ncbi:hypothetical protein [Subtercola sp. RTI3]|uniref:hypothetical protein n=1 Tax=Subtercola sp. RTI3 TaxID=3048639 RepID=UPI002B22398C|nr:hypothetical protein [Subtercola sp. RTI3]MEA9986182.1 hypothetical protein [Subtercola sp. RTI3]